MHAHILAVRRSPAQGRRLPHPSWFLLLPLLLASWVPVTAAPLERDTIDGGRTSLVFEDRFEGRLGAEWSWLRENTSAWRLHAGALEIRVEPGAADTVRNALVRPAPDRRQGRFAIDVTVHNLTPPTQQYEQAGITWYSDGKPVFKLVKERVDGQLMIIPGRKPMTNDAVQLRLIVSPTNYIAQFRPSATGEFQTAATGALEPAAREQVSLQCYHGPPDAEHWIRFDDFRILRLAE